MKNYDLYKLALQKIPYGTIKELFRLEGEVINDFVIKSVHFFLSKSIYGLRKLDSNHTILGDFFTEEKMIELITKFEFTKDSNVDQCVDNGDTVRISLLEQPINVSSTKVLYLEINKKFLKIN